MTLVSFFHRFIGPPPPPQVIRPLSSWTPSDRYWAPTIDSFLRRGRFSTALSAGAWRTERCEVQPRHAGAHAAIELSPGEWLWSAWLTATVRGAEPDDERLAAQDFLAGAAAWRPLHPGFVQPRLAREDASASTTVDRLLASSLPDDVRDLVTGALDQSVIDDRLCVLVLVDRPAPKAADALRAWLDVDPAQGMEAPQDWAQQWIEGRVYRRWAQHGTTFGFSHHAGVCFSAKPPPWMTSLFEPRSDPDAPPARGAYFDLALLAFTEAALLAISHGSALTSGRGERGAPTEARSTLRRLRSTFSTAADQGRALLRTWRRAIDEDLRSCDGASLATDEDGS